jgi:hypothetical protein
VADKPSAAQLTLDADEKISFDSDQSKACCYREPGRARAGEQRVTEMPK